MGLNMNLKNDMLLYHGSYCTVTKPDLSICKQNRDFGRGFYLTSDKQQAMSFIKTSYYRDKQYLVSSSCCGFVSVFQYHPVDGIDIHTFDDANESWFKAVTAHRRPQQHPEIINLYQKYDIIAGKIANDKTNAVILAYLSGLYGQMGSKRAIYIAISLLNPEKLTDQFCFRTPKALDSLTYIESQEYYL